MGARFDITLTPNGSGSTVILNGHDISNQISMIETRSAVNHATEVTLTFVAPDVIMAGQIPHQPVFVYASPGDWEDWY